MQHKFCLKFKIEGLDRTAYFKGNNSSQAMMRCIQHHKNQGVISRIEVVGDPLPVAKDFAAKQIIRELKAKENKKIKWQAALKYQRLTGLHPYESKPRKNR